MPLTSDVGKNMRILHEENKKKPRHEKRPRAQMIAIAIEAARKAGAKIPKKKKS